MLFLNFRFSIVFLQLLKQNYQRELHREMKKNCIWKLKNYFSEQCLSRRYYLFKVNNENTRINFNAFMKDVYYHPFEWRKPSVIDPSLPDLGRRGKINLNSYFHT